MEYSTSAAEGMAQAIKWRLANRRELLEEVRNHPNLAEVIDTVAERHAHWEEIGSSDVSCAVLSVLEELRRISQESSK